MAATEQNDTIVSGDNRNIVYTVDDGKSPPQPINLTGGSVLWGIYRSKLSAAPQVFKSSALSSEIEITDPPNGKFTVKLVPTDTEDLSGDFHMEAQFTDGSSNVSTVAFGTLSVTQDAVVADGQATDPVIVEDGTIIANANAYDSVANTDAYHDSRNNSVWTSASLRKRQASVIRATDYLVQTYRMRWKGIRIDTKQTLDWPRKGVIREDYFNPQFGARAFGVPLLAFEVGEKEIPIEVKFAMYEAALRDLSGELSPDLERGGAVKRLKAGSAEIEYFQGASPSRKFPVVENYLAPLLSSMPGTRMLARA